MRVRPPAHAGTFYPATPEDLVRAIEDSFRSPLGPGGLPPKTFSEPLSPAYLVPHAGYMYSGPVAAHAYYQLSLEERPELVVIVGPNHTGLGLAASVYTEGYWKTPLGEVPVDSEAAKLMVEYSGFLAPDEKAHLYEHSVEVQLPFLQYLYGEPRIVPIVVLHQTLDVAYRIAAAFRRLREENGVRAVMVATSDLNHYEPYDVTVEKDRAVLDALASGDPRLLWRAIESRGVSACGPTPLAVVAALSEEYGVKPVILKYANSGDVTGEKSWVVGYPAARLPAAG